jgi:hypothetical protein
MGKSARVRARSDMVGWLIIFFRAPLFLNLSPVCGGDFLTEEKD